MKEGQMVQMVSRDGETSIEAISLLSSLAEYFVNQWHVSRRKNLTDSIDSFISKSNFIYKVAHNKSMRLKRRPEQSSK